jgi:hypothetical protein
LFSTGFAISDFEGITSGFAIGFVQETTNTRDEWNIFRSAVLAFE